jgi:hypothetical protein
VAGEHLPLSNYDDLTAAEVVRKLKILLDGGSPNLDAVREYELARPDGGRDTILDLIDQHQGTVTLRTSDRRGEVLMAGSPEATALTSGPDTSAQGTSQGAPNAQKDKG